MMPPNNALERVVVSERRWYYNHRLESALVFLSIFSGGPNVQGQLNNVLRGPVEFS
jgi:hypothetical protein